MTLVTSDNPNVGINSTPAEIQRDIIFSESFKSNSKFLLNGGNIDGSPTFVDSGILLSASDSIYWPVNTIEIGTTNSIVLIFTPYFDISSGDEMVDSTWFKNERNCFCVSTDGTNFSIVFNGVKWENPALFSFTNDFISITSLLTIFNFSGIIHEIKIFNSFLTDTEQNDYCNGEAFTYESYLYLDLPCNHRANDTIGFRAKDITGNNRHATLGDGYTASTMPVKLPEKNGYYFNGVTNYLSGLVAPENEFTVVVCSRVNEIVSVTFEEDLTTFNKLIANGLFSGYLLSLRIFNKHLTELQRNHERILLLNRIDENYLQKSFINELINEESCVFYNDYRRGSFKDLSLSGNDGIPSDTLVWDDESIDCWASNACVVVPADTSLNITQGSIVILSDFNPNYDTEYLISKRDSGGTSFELYIGDMGNSIKFYDGTFTRTLSTSVYNTNCISINFNNDEKVELFKNGQFIDTLNSVSSISINDAPITIGCKYDFSLPSYSKIKAILIFNRKLSHEEHERIFEELTNNTFETEVYVHNKLSPRETVIVRDNGLIAAYDGSVMESNTLFNLKKNLYNITLDGQTLKNTYFNSLYNHVPGNSLNTGIISSILDPAGINHTVCALVKLNEWQTLDSKIIALFGKGLYGSSYSAPRCGGVYIDTEYLGRKIVFSTFDSATSRYKTIKTSYAAELNTWYFIVYTIDHINDTSTLYVNGELIGTTSIGTMHNNIDIKKDGFRFFGVNIVDSAVVDSPKVEMNYMQIYRGVKDLSWVSSQFENYKKACLSFSFAAQESIVAENSLTNTDFQNADYVMLVDDIIENQHCKVIEGTINSAINIKVKHLE